MLHGVVLGTEFHHGTGPYIGLAVGNHDVVVSVRRRLSPAQAAELSDSGKVPAFSSPLPARVVSARCVEGY